MIKLNKVIFIVFFAIVLAVLMLIGCDYLHYKHKKDNMNAIAFYKLQNAVIDFLNKNSSDTIDWDDFELYIKDNEDYNDLWKACVKLNLRAVNRNDSIILYDLGFDELDGKAVVLNVLSGSYFGDRFLSGDLLLWVFSVTPKNLERLHPYPLTLIPPLIDIDSDITMIKEILVCNDNFKVDTIDGFVVYVPSLYIEVLFENNTNEVISLNGSRESKLMAEIVTTDASGRHETIEFEKVWPEKNLHPGEKCKLYIYKDYLSKSNRLQVDGSHSDSILYYDDLHIKTWVSNGMLVKVYFSDRTLTGRIGIKDIH